MKGKGKVFYGQEFHRGESTTTVCWSELSTASSNAIEVAQRETPSCSRQQPATGNGIRDGRYNCLSVTP